MHLFLLIKTDILQLSVEPPAILSPGKNVASVHIMNLGAAKGGELPPLISMHAEQM